MSLSSDLDGLGLLVGFGSTGLTTGVLVGAGGSWGYSSVGGSLPGLSSVGGSLVSGSSPAGGLVSVGGGDGVGYDGGCSTDEEGGVGDGGG